MTTRHHEYKCWPVYFQAVWMGLKRFEVRETRGAAGGVRDPRAGDTVILREYDDAGEDYTGRAVQVTVLYVMPGGRFGLDEDHIVFGFDLGVRVGLCTEESTQE